MAPGVNWAEEGQTQWDVTGLGHVQTAESRWLPGWSVDYNLTWWVSFSCFPSLFSSLSSFLPSLSHLLFSPVHSPFPSFSVMSLVFYQIIH